MAQFNAEFGEISAAPQFIEGVPAESALWFETQVDRDRRYALLEFFQQVMPAVQEVIEDCLTRRQREILALYYFDGMTQQDIAAALDLTQSTVSRHLFGTVRNGKRVGGAVPKLRKAIEEEGGEVIDAALESLQQRFAQTAELFA
ncbi:MAG: sigma-70 family RNA polymerase sigma factor [FCB group bacterium]|jgi:DNA-directed RNA polymerase specialized sigma24 family protein|nr:sigma-70 family RNA polymerase sigma factor [FCB group bacterium]